ncbi:isochorismatase family cysteine hydrolase [Nocardioides aquiterrae]|uniref:Hydrolase n=1 Tax=Nocardioides aquiterrae TaxID=203799 RepID=A0ABP4EYL8_9ACTN
MSDLLGQSTALLVVHLQEDIVAEGTAFGSIFAAEAAARDVVEHTNVAMRAIRDHGGLVVPLRIAFASDHSDLRPTLPLLQMVEQAGCLKDGTTGAELVADLAVEDDDVVLTHKRPGPFTDSDLEEVLRNRGIENVVVCGVATNASVEGAVRQAADLGFHVAVLTDATSAADGGSHEASLASMGLFATLVTVEELAAGISR